MVWGSGEAYNISSLKSVNISSPATLINIHQKSIYRAADIIKPYRKYYGGLVNGLGM